LMKYIDKNTVIHCKTYQDAVAVLEILYHNGFTWNTGESYKSTSNYKFHQSETCYLPIEGLFSRREFFEKKGYTVIDSSQFIRANRWKLD
jgi:hypothetical protein